jgi:2-methylcitrate dehydratase PrpD
VQAMIAKVDFGVNAEAEAAGFDKMTTIVEVELADGRRVSGRADFGKGSPANPMSDGELSDKFRQCAAWGGVPAAHAEAILDTLWRIEALADVNDLTRLLSV